MAQVESFGAVYSSSDRPPVEPSPSAPPFVRPTPRLVGALPFIAIHLAALASIFVEGITAVDWVVALGLYYARMVGITAGYHRLFSHRAFKANRVLQFALAFLGASAAQKGPIWWAAHHRHHHKRSDMPDDIHSPKDGFWYSHFGWIFVKANDDVRTEKVPDLLRLPEIVWIDKHWLVPPTVLAVVVLLIGGLPMLFVGFFVSTVVLYHGTFFINSLAHVWGSRRFATTDTSRNNFWLALITCGEGWHNNHHHYQSSANQGFYWWEVDLSYYVIRAFAAVGLAWDVRTPSSSALAKDRIKGAAPRESGASTTSVEVARRVGRTVVAS